MAEYDGYLRASTEQNIYDPGSGVRLHFEDCYEGFVCIRSRWREDDISGNGNNPDSRYLQVTYVLLGCQFCYHFIDTGILE